MITEQKEKRKMPTPEELEKMMVVPAPLVAFGVLLLQVLIFGLPAAAVSIPFLIGTALWHTLVWAVCAPVVYAVLLPILRSVVLLSESDSHDGRKVRQ